MQFDRLLKIITYEQLEKLNQTKILIVGIGGVGGYALEAIVRSGIENITIVDSDDIDITNLNRQIISLHSNIGKKKVDVAKSSAKDINPNVKITTYDTFVLDSNIDSLFKHEYDYIIDACDTSSTKVALIKKAHELGIKIISCMGTGNKFDPTKLSITEIKKTNYDPLAKVLRKLLKDLGINNKVMVVSSTESPVKTSDRTPGSIITVPAVAGLYCATYVINDILEKH